MPIIPLGDDNPHRSFHFINWAILIAAAGVMAYAVWVDHNTTLNSLLHWMHPAGTHIDMNSADLKLLVTGLFMHQNPLLFGLYAYMLWMLGDNVEYAMGHIRYTLFFLLCGCGALFAQAQWHMDGDSIPAIGLGGAAFAVMGAYIACFPKIKVDIIYWFQETSISVKWLPAIYMLGDIVAGLWFTRDSVRSFDDVILMQYLRIAIIHFAFFWVGYILFFLFRDRSVVIDLPLHKRFRERTGSGHDWEHHN